MEKTEEYIKLFDDWVAEGNRLLKIGDTAFLPIIDYETGIILIYACDNVHTYKKWVPKQLFGKMIYERKKGRLIYKNINHIPLHDFARDLIYWDSQWSFRQDMSIVLILFSFNQIDTGQLPERIVEELVRQKLSK